MSLLFNMLSRLVITFLPRSKCLLISWLQSPYAVILEPPKIKSDTVSTVSPSICHPVSPSVWIRIWHPILALLLGESHGWRSLEGCSPWGCKESDTTERLHFHFSLSCIGERNGNPLQCSCLENPRDRGAWWAAVYGVAQSRTRLKRLSSSSRINLITWTTAWSNLMKLWAMPCRATQDGRVMVESSVKMWSTREGNGKPLEYPDLKTPWTIWKGKKIGHWKMNFPGR